MNDEYSLKIKGDQFFILDPAQPPKAGTILNPVKLSIGDTAGDKIISVTGADLIGGMKVTRVWVKDTITVDMGKGPIKVVGVTFYRQGGPAVFTPIDGTVLTDAKFIKSSYVVHSTQISIDAFGPPCFVHGTAILTATGNRVVQDLRAGDSVITKDHGAQTLRWVGQSTVNGLDLFAPIHFLPGALGNVTDLRVSPQHRMLISGWRAELLFGQIEVLVAAKHLINGRTIFPSPTPKVGYFHLLFDRHCIVFSEGIPSESFYPGNLVLAANRGMLAELAALFPALVDGAQDWRLAAKVVTGAETRALQL